MPETIIVELERPIESVELADVARSPEAAEQPGSSVVGTNARVSGSPGESLQNQDLGDVFQALDSAANELKHMQQNIIREHKEQIAKLAVEIARKLLMQEIKEGDYEIEAIIQEALNNVPTMQNVVVHLNPEDFAQCQISEAENEEEKFKDIKLVPDPNIGKAECLVETPKGMIESVIDEHLESIAKAFTNTE
ncbi:MAG: FliH/SctL family protein [Planctomycetota bacterium]|jgi:flagellar biosynthesis/type III secretory pathway protein FliH